jgi:hypothetical protein
MFLITLYKTILSSWRKVFQQNFNWVQCVMAHPCDPSTLEAEAGGS